jgi:predicted DNA-binding transcriptional regulator AlpA
VTEQQQKIRLISAADIAEFLGLKVQTVYTPGVESCKK